MPTEAEDLDARKKLGAVEHAQAQFDAADESVSKLTAKKADKEKIAEAKAIRDDARAELDAAKKNAAGVADPGGASTTTVSAGTAEGEGA